MFDKFKIAKNLQDSTKEFKLKRELTLPPISFSTEKVTRQNSVYLSASIRRETPNFIVEKEQDNFEDQFVKSEYEILKMSSDSKIVNCSSQLLDEIEDRKPIPRKPCSTTCVNYRLTYVVVDRIEKGGIFVHIFYYLEIR